MDFRNFHKKSGVISIRDPRMLFDQQPPSIKEYPRLESVSLPAPRIPDASLLDSLAARASHRDFNESKEMPLEALSALLFAGPGIQKKPSRNGDVPSRHHPSGGALYPLECYVAAFRVESLEAGLYHYHPVTHALERLPGDAEEIWNSCKDLIPTKKPACIAVITSVWDRTYPKYGEFAYRLALMEAGHMAQDMLLCAGAAHIKNCPAAGFSDTKVAKALDIEKDAEDPLYILLLGV